MKLYTYWRSSASYRVRIALEWKGIPREDVFVNLRRGEQHHATYLDENPEGRVPLLVEGELRIGQALAILEYLEESHPDPPLLPSPATERARVRQLALLIVADTQPLQNLGPLQYLGDPLGVDDAGRARWYTHWVRRGLAAFEAHVAGHSMTGRFSHGDVLSLADVCLVPQLANAQRFGIDLTEYPTLERIGAACQALPAFQRAAPEAQPDAEPDSPE